MKIITAAERAARRLTADPKPATIIVPSVIWRKKGCSTCKPIVIPLSPSVTKPST